MINAGDKFIRLQRLLGMFSASKLCMMRAFPGMQRDSTVRVQLRGFASAFWVRPRSSDLDVALQIFLARDYDLSRFQPYKLHILDLCHRICREGNIPLIIDAGANIGASTLWFALNFPDCQVFAVEPDVGNFATLERNSEGHPNIRLFNAGLWDRPTALSPVYENGTGWACRVEEKSCGKARISSVTIPELLAEDERLRPVIVKIDIEGAETEVLRSNNEWVDDVPLLIFEAHDNFWHWLGTWQGTGHAFFSTLVRRKREYLSRGENMFAFLYPEPLEQKARSSVGN